MHISSLLFPLTPTGLYSDNGFAWQCLKTTKAAIHALDIFKRPKSFLEQTEKKKKKKRNKERKEKKLEKKEKEKAIRQTTV